MPAVKSFLSNLTADLRIMPRGVWVLVGGQFVNRLGSFVYPFLAIYLTRTGYTLGQVTPGQGVSYRGAIL